MAHILLGEEIADLRHVLTRLLHRAGHQVTAVTTGNELLHHTTGHTPDLILMNPTLPGTHGDGLHTCRQLRADPRTATTPILMLSVYSYPTHAEAAHQAGATDFIGKPFDNHDLLARTAALLTTRTRPT